MHSNAATHRRCQAAGSLQPVRNTAWPPSAIRTCRCRRPRRLARAVGAPFADDAFVVGALVTIAQTGCEIDSLAIRSWRSFELVGQGQDQGNLRRLVVRIDLKTSRQMLSASPGSLSSRYRSAFVNAASIASRESGFSVNISLLTIYDRNTRKSLPSGS